MKLFKKEPTADATFIWNYYEKGVDWHNKNRIYSDTEKFYNMFEGRQWSGIESGNETLSMYNFIQPVCEYKIAMIAMQNMSINYSPLNSGEGQDVYRQACELLNEYAASKWELKKMDSKAWEIVKQACIGGDSYLFFYNKDLDAQIIDRTNIYLSDEQNPDIQKQKYILIYERRFVDDVKEDARANGIPEDQISLIVGDDDTDNLPQNVKDNEVKTGDKCSCLLYLTKKKLPAPFADEYGVYIARSTQTVIYQPEQPNMGMQDGQPVGKGITLYPIVNFLWSTKRYSARGIGEVEPLVNNQINANKLLARRELNAKICGFPKPVYNAQMIGNPEDVDKIGVGIKVNGNVAKIREAFDYVTAEPMSTDVKALQDELIDRPRNLASAGDYAMGDIDPEKASGAAIVAVKDQQAIATTGTSAAYKQFDEDIAAIWLDTWVAYNPNGLTVEIEQDGQLVEQVIPAEVLQQLKVNIRIDISPTNPYSKFALQQQIDNLVASPIFADTQLLDEYHDLLEDDNPIKGKIDDLLDKRNEMMELQQQSELAKAQQLLAEQSALIEQLLGGEQNVVPAM